MARPKKEGMDYFPHDTDAVNDEKIEALRMIYGNDGYAFYFILLERIYRSKDFELDVSDAETIQILAKKVDVTPEKFGNMLETAIKRGCFDKDYYEEYKILTSEGVKKRASVVTKKRETMREKYRNDAIPDNNSEVSDVVSDAETLQKVHKVKETKQNKTKDTIPFVEIIDYLNLKAGTKYKSSGKKTRELITARWNDKFAVDDFKVVIDKKVADANNPNDLFNGKYLRPETLFGSKFESYLNQLDGTKKEPKKGGFRKPEAAVKYGTLNVEDM